MQKVLNSKEIKQILNWLKAHYGLEELKIDKVFLKSTKDKLYLINKRISELETKDLRLNLVGMYFAKEEKKGIRLSIEGSQIIGPKATKNVVELNEQQINDWIRGQDISYHADVDGFVIIRHNKDFYGVGNYIDGKILNYVPKERRIKRI